MFDIGMTELLLIGIVALIVIGPKDLPVLFHTLGRFTAKARSMAREFSRAMNDAAKESGMDSVSKDLKSMTSSKNLGLDSLKDAATKFEKWDPKKSLDTDTMGPATKALTEERAEAAKKINEAAAKKAEERIAREKAAEEAASSAPAEASAKPAAKPKPKAAPKATATKAAAKPKAKPKAKKSDT